MGVSFCLSIQRFQSVEVCVKSLRQLVLSRTGVEEGVGCVVEAELSGDRDDQLRVFVTDVDPRGPAHRSGQPHGRRLSNSFSV